MNGQMVKNENPPKPRQLVGEDGKIYSVAPDELVSVRCKCGGATFRQVPAVYVWEHRLTHETAVVPAGWFELSCLRCGVVLGGKTEGPK